MGTLDLVGFNVILGSFGALFQNGLYLKKTAGRRAKWSEIWKSAILVTHIWGTFDLAGFNVILGSFGAFSSKWLVTRQRLAVERKRLKFETQGH